MCAIHVAVCQRVNINRGMDKAMQMGYDHFPVAIVKNLLLYGYWRWIMLGLDTFV